jgi:hypothetical protein
MKIIKRGKVDKEKSATFDCHACRSKLEAEASEGVLMPDQRDGDYYLFRCPVCQAGISVSVNLFN